MGAPAERPRYEGLGTISDPVRRPNWGCAFMHCKARMLLWRLTRSGFCVGYCDAHVQQARQLFGEAAEFLLA